MESEQPPEQTGSTPSIPDCCAHPGQPSRTPSENFGCFPEKGDPPPIAGGQDAENPNEKQSQSTDAFVEQYRRTRAKDLGLPEDTSWGVIYAFEDQQERMTIAAELGWIENPETTDELLRVGLDPYPSWRNILTDVLGVSRTASATDIIEQIRKVGSGN